jgi:hypothetical protein
MGKFTATHEINCNSETFWKIFFDKEFNEQLHREALGYPEFSVVEQRETETVIVRKCNSVPRREFPGPLAKLLGSGYREMEEGSLDKATEVWAWETIPSSMTDKLRLEGTLRVEATGDDKVRRVAEFGVEAKIFAVGGLLESSFEKMLRNEWDISAVFMNKWIADGNTG